jgi:hypothetical protein
MAKRMSGGWRYRRVASQGYTGAVAPPAVGGGALLEGEANGFAADFLYATDASRVALKTGGSTVAYAVDAFYQQAGTSPKMVYDAAGVLGWSPHNYVLQSQTFDNASWNLQQAIIAANATAAPDGTTTADAFIPNSGVADCFVQGSMALTNGVVNTLSVYAKNGTLGNNWLHMFIFGSSEFDVWFNLATGVKGTSIGSPVSYTITSVGNGWYRITLTFAATAASGAVYIVPRPADGSQGTVVGDGTSPAFYLWGAQMNRGSTALAYLPTTTAARVGLALDYDPVTHAARGLLCEPQATNLILNNATFATQSVTVTATAYTLSIFGTGTITLTGTSTAGPLVGTGANNRVSLTFTPTAGSLTLTKSGTVTNAQLETGSVATSVIPTLASVTRAADQVSVTSASINYSATAGSWWVEHFVRSGQGWIIGQNTSSAPTWHADDAYFLSSGTNLSINGTGILNNVNKVIAAFQAGDRAITFNGFAPATDAGVATNLLNPASINFGSGTGGIPITGYIRKVRYLPRRPTNAELQTMTT